MEGKAARSAITMHSMRKNHPTPLNTWPIERPESFTPAKAMVFILFNSNWHRKAIESACFYSIFKGDRFVADS